MNHNSDQHQAEIASLKGIFADQRSIYDLTAELVKRMKFATSEVERAGNIATNVMSNIEKRLKTFKPVGPAPAWGAGDSVESLKKGTVESYEALAAGTKLETLNNLIEYEVSRQPSASKYKIGFVNKSESVSHNLADFKSFLEDDTFEILFKFNEMIILHNPNNQIAMMIRVDSDDIERESGSVNVGELAYLARRLLIIYMFFGIMIEKLLNRVRHRAFDATYQIDVHYEFLASHRGALSQIENNHFSTSASSNEVYVHIHVNGVSMVVPLGMIIICKGMIKDNLKEVAVEHDGNSFRITTEDFNTFTFTKKRTTKEIENNTGVVIAAPLSAIIASPVFDNISVSSAAIPKYKDRCNELTFIALAVYMKSKYNIEMKIEDIGVMDRILVSSVSETEIKPMFDLFG